MMWCVSYPTLRGQSQVCSQQHQAMLQFGRWRGSGPLSLVPELTCYACFGFCFRVPSAPLLQ